MKTTPSWIALAGVGLIAAGCQPQPGGAGDKTAPPGATAPAASPAASVLGPPPGGAEAAQKMMQQSKDTGKPKP